MHQLNTSSVRLSGCMSNASLVSKRTVMVTFFSSSTRGIILFLNTAVVTKVGGNPSAGGKWTKGGKILSTFYLETGLRDRLIVNMKH